MECLPKYLNIMNNEQEDRIKDSFDEFEQKVFDSVENIIYR